MARQHFFGGVDLLQDFPEQQSYFEQTYQNDFEQPHDYQMTQTQPYKPKNLGIIVFTTLQNEYKQRRKVNTYSADALYDLWKVINRSNTGKPKPKKPSREPEGDLMKKQLEHRENLYFFSQADGRDVQFTLRQYAKEEEQDANISKFLEERKSQIRQSELQKPKKRQMSEKVLNRLYPQKQEQFEDPKSQQNQQRNQLVETVIRDYKRKNPESKNFKYPDLLKEYWSKMDNKPEGSPEAFQEYFTESMEIINENFYKFKGFYTDNVNEIIKIWRQIPEKQKSEQEIIKYESEENLKALLSAYIEDKKYNENIATGMRKLQMEQSQKKPKQELDKNKLKEMAKPKDRLKVGKTLLEMRKAHPHDPIIRRMILDEFKDTKVAKYPLEYDVADSDEDNRQKMRHVSQQSKAISLEEMEVNENMRAEEIAELFERHLQEYYSEKQRVIRAEKQKQQLIKKEDAKLKQNIENMARKYLELRKKRLEEKVPTVNEYLSSMYKQLLKSFKEAVQRNFPHSTKGESKKLRQKSFPSSLKRYFFAMMKSYVRRKYDFVKDKTNRLGFWAPTNGKSMCVVHKDSLCPPGCNRQSLNQRVHEQSKLVKESKVSSIRAQTSVWDSESYQSERKNIMMTFSDAKECTFQPAVCFRMPSQYKKIVLDTHNWGEQIVSKKGTIKHFLEQFGENFKKVPTIYRFGMYKRSIIAYRKGDYRKSYQLLAQSFNIHDLKIIFKDPELKLKVPKEHPIFNNQNLGIEEDEAKKQPHEDMQLVDPQYQAKPEYMFLQEVYQFIQQLENYEEQLVQSQQNVKKLLNQDKSRFIKDKSTLSQYNLRKTQVKDQMCPLGESCPALQTRWPNSNITGVTPIGAECLFAHHPYELRFHQELCAKKNALRGTLKQIAAQLGGNAGRKAWNPAGNTLSICIGCSEKTLCSDCQIKKANIKTLNILSKKAKEAYTKIKSKPQFKQKRIMQQNEENNFKHKVGYLSRANALFNKERYSESFDIILKAVEIVKNEIDEKEKSFEKSQQVLKQQLHLDVDVDISLKQVYESTIKPNPDDKFEAQKLYMFAKQTGMDSDPEPDTNRFINTQIELLYRKIEHALTSTVKDIDMMKQKITKIEDQEDQKQKSKTKSLKNKMCPDFIKTGLCKKGQKDCAYSHNYLILDLAPPDSKIKNLQESIKVKEVSLRESKPPLPWVATGVKDAEKFNDTKAYDKLQEKNKIVRSKSKQTNRNNSKNSKELYDQDFEDIKTPIHERKKNNNY